MNNKILFNEVDEIIAGGPAENERVALCRIGNHEGIIDIDGHVIVPFRYASINGFVWDESKRLLVINDEDLLGAVDIEGREVIPCQFPFRVLSDPFCFQEDRLPVIDRNGLIGFIDPMGKMVIPGKYYEVKHFSQGFCPVKNGKGLWAYIDKDGHQRTPFKYKHASVWLNTGKALVEEQHLLFFSKMKTINLSDLGRLEHEH